MDKTVQVKCKVSHLVMDGATYRKGNIFTLPYERAVKLGTSVEILEPTVSEKVPVEEKKLAPKPEPKPTIEQIVEGVKLSDKKSFNRHTHV